MSSVFRSLFHSLRFLVRSRASLHLEILALRHQLAVVHRWRRHRLRLTSPDRMLWAWLSRTWRDWRSALHVVRPETVIGWHRRGFRLFWTWTSRHRTGRPGVSKDVRALIRELATANPLWGAADSRRAAEIGHLGESVHRSQVHATTLPVAIANLAHLPHEPRRTDHGGRLLRRADRHLPTALCPRHPCSRSETDRAPGDDRSSHRRMDRPAGFGMPSLTTRRPPIFCTVGMARLPRSRPPSHI